MIVKMGNEWILLDRNGERILGRHATQEDALRQERAIQIAKARRRGHVIPPPR